MSQKKDRALRKQAIQSRVSGGTYVRCAQGHRHAHLRSGADAQGKYLEVWCTEPGCTVPTQRIHRGDLDEG